MPIFENKGVKYDVSPEYIPDFASEYPDAVTVIERPDKPYRVKASQYDIFMLQHPEPDISVDEMRDTDNFFEDFGERLAAGAGRLVGSSTNLLKKITTPVESAVDWANEYTKGAAGAAAQSLAGTIPGLGMIAHIPDKNAGLERLSKNAEAFAEDMHERSDRYKGKSFSDLWSEGDYQGAFGSAFLDAAESAATSAAIAATGGAGLVAAGLTTASDKYDELSRENPEMGETLKWANAIGTGAAESLSEVFGAGMMGRTVKNILQKSGREAAANLVKKNFLDKIASFEGKHWFAMPIASEGLEEAGNALAGYAIDRLTGVERNDNIFKTMLDAGVAGSMGGAQFSPFIGAAKGYSAYQKRQIANRYKESSTFAGEILHEDVEKFNDAIVNRLKNPKSIQSFIDNVASVKNLNPEEKRKLEQYTVDLLNYNGYVDYVQSRIDEETRRRMDDVGRTANKDMGKVVTVKFPSSDQPVYITGGNIVFDEEGLVDAKQSDDILYYLDENGKVQQGRPEMFDSLIEQYPVEQLYADIINTVPGEVIAQEEMESEAADMQPVMFNPGDLVNLVDGRQGIVQQMSDDGGVIVEVDGMTEEIGLDSIIDNMSKNQTQNEDSSTDGDSKVLENVPEKTLDSVVASLPKRNDGTIDYKAMTPQQQYEYTSLSESPQTALEDLRADIESKRSEISKSESRIEKASGGERASLRDEMRVKKQELADLEAFYQTVTPDAEDSAEGNVILPEGVIASQTEIPINQESDTPESSIPMDEAGNPVYHQAEISDTLDALLDGSLTLEEVDQFVNNHISDAERRLTESGKKAPVMELDIDGYKARKKEWEEGRKPIEQEKSYWEDIKSKLQDARVKPGEEAAINLMRNTAPQSGEELAAQMLANGSIKLLQDDYRRETGGRISESRSLFGLFAGKDKGGVSIERAGEILMQADLENGSNFFDQNDPNAGRNAIIEVLSTARTRGDLINYIKNRREAKAEEMRQAEYNEYARWCEENYHLSPEDYEAYEEDLRRQAQTLTDETVEYVSGEIADEIRDIEEELSEIDAILAENKNNPDETIKRDDERRTGSLHERGDQLLQEEQSVPIGRTGEIETEHPGVDNGIRNADGAAQESAPGEIKPIGKGAFGDIYNQFRGKAKEAIKFLLRKRSGEAIGALHHKEVGDIDLVWGKEGTGKSNGFGLSKLAKFHPEVLDSLQDILDDMVVISRSANRVNLESKTHKAAVRLEWDGEKKNWLLTAFEKEKPTATDRTTDIGDTELQNDTAPLQTESSSTDKDSDSSRNINDLSEKIADAEANTDINPTEAQKEAGNYKKGHVRVGTFDISIEQPKGSVRSGVDANGKKWETTMQNTYGYIRGTEGVDGDHIDVFLSDDIDGWNGRKAFVVDQYNEDGSFDEHKVMLGFNEVADAETAYFANYDKDWAKKHKTVVTPVNLEDFEKWIGSSHRKTKAFAEYKSVRIDSLPSGQPIVKGGTYLKNNEAGGDAVAYVVGEEVKDGKRRYMVSFAPSLEDAKGRLFFGDKFLTEEELKRRLEDGRLSPMEEGKMEAVTDAPYTITPAQYTTKRGKVLDMQIVKFGRELSKDEFRSANAFAKSLKGWYDAKQRGFLMRSEDDAKQLVNAVIPKENAVLSVTQPEDSEHAVENSPQADEDIFQMAERIAKENARKAEEAGKEPVSLEQWKHMDGDARMAEAGKRPLTREEIENSSTDEVLRANALDYLDGNQGMIQSISYLKVYEDVRYSNRTAAADSGATDSAQLDTSATGNEQRVDVRDRGQSGKPDARLDRNAGEERISAEDRPLHADTSDARGDASGNGNGSSEPFFVRESVLQPGDAGGDVHRGSGVRSREGRDVGGGTGRKGHTASRKDSERGVQAGTAGNAKDDRGLSLNDPIEKELADALKEFDSVLDEFKRAGKEELSMSLAGLNSRQLEVLPRLVSAGAKVGYAYIKKGAHNFSEWAKRMREVFGGKLKEAGLGDNEIDAFIKEMWKSKLPMDGETHTVEEWASIIGKAELRKKIGGTLEEKRKAQQAAEPIPVKTCDRENIAETLPFLLPQQQDDVLKAETQFFDDSHSDRDHAFGKGYMFTNGTGTGKTYTGLGIVKRFIKQGKGRILVLTPSQKKVTDWIEDATNLGIELTTLDKIAKDNGTTAVTEKGEGAVITTYANFRQNKALLEDLFDLIVYDESHRLLENKGGIGTTGANQHYKLSNRNEQYAFLRLQEVNPIWNKMKKKESEFHKKRDSIIDRLKKESGITNELTFEQRGQFPPVLYGNWTADSERKFPELNKLRKEIDDLFSKYDKEIKPELERQAKENVKHTKVVFLSATPFNTRENLDYAEGYIFSYPENDKQAGYSVQSPRSQFYLEHFGSGYKWRYNRLESSMVNPDAVSKQEVEFSNYLQNTLQTMSGRIIDSPFDYSRDFPTVTMEKADEFNSAMEELSRNEATRSGYYKMMGDYNYSGALFESMKVTQIIPRLKEHLSRGRKVVIFHRRVESKNPLIPPFKSIFDLSIKALEEEYDATKKAENKKEIARLRRKYADMLEWEQTLDLRMPREQLADAFGKDNVLFFSGKESEKVKNKAVKDFNNDQSGKDIIVIQENSGKEGISLHDTTGNHQRVLVTLALPQSPITALQIEGRIYRIGNKSNAIFEYPLLGLNAELMLFGQKFNQQVSTTENLALGSQARNLRESFARGVEEHSGDVDIDNQGVGGKEFDAPNPIETDAFDGAVLDYYTNQKLNGKRDSREGMDYYPTPEPLGFMMNQWARISEGESVLEPSAGHGAIARYVPRENPLTAVEPSQSLFGKLQIKAGGNGRKFENTIFENYNVVNKHDVVLMNPPFGTGGRLAVDHVAKAFQHLEEGGRIVAIIPRGSTDKKFDKWYEGQKDAVLTAEIGLPDITFERAGTSVNCRVVVIDKVTNGDLRKKAASYASHIDLDGHYDKIEDFFEELRDVEVPERTIDQKAKLKKKAAPVARELRTVKGVRDVYLNENSISVSGRSVWDKIEWNDKKGNELTVYLSERYRRFKLNYDNAAKNENETSEAVYGELKDLACKLAGMTEDEMQRYIDKNIAENVRFRESSTVNTDIEKANERFNYELQRQIDGSLPKGHVYKLGNPSRFLQAAGFPDLPIELRADKLATKASEKYKSNHPFNLTSVENLPQAIANPIAVFDSKTRIDAKVVLTELESNGDNFVVAIQVNRKVGNIEINSVRSIYPKDYVKDIYSWINDGLLKWVDKKKATDFISNSSTPANVDDKNSSFSSATKIVESFVNPTLDEGKISSAVDELAGNLNTPVHIIRDINDITDEDKDTQRKKRGSKGWYDTKTGEVYLVLSNAENIADVQATILHEVVAHKGLRGLFGEKFDDMMDSVYRNLPKDVRRKVARAGLSRYGGNFRIATEEYLASVAENGVSEPSIWQKIKSAIRGFFRSLGIDLRMRDEDIAYMLWKSKNRLEKGDSLVTIIHKVAKDGNMRDTLLFRDPLMRGGTILSTPSEDRRTMIRTIGAVSEGVRSFSAMTREFYKRFREGYQDQKIHIRDFQKAVEKETGHKVKDYEDAYIYENTTQGRAEYDVNHFKANEFAALVNEVARLSRDGKNIDKDKRCKVDLYMKAKHGLERNEVMRREALASVEQPSPELIESISNKDFAGLTAITKALSAETKGMDEDIVRQFVEEFEKENDTKKLWEAVGKATRATLEKMYQCNLISRESRDRISGKYEYYVPLKEWEETTAGDIWDYIDSNRDIVSNPIKKAKGRTSMAGDILANIASDYESATMMGYKNLVKLRFANLVRNSKTGMASVSRQWYVRSGVDAEGRTLWEPVSATGLTEDAETNASIINDFEEKMKELQEKGEAKTQREVLNLGVPIKDWQEQQHVVRVKEGGRDLLVYINGNPVVSQAVNGLNRASLDNVVLKGLNNVRKFMMQNYTSRNINFILRNFARDFFYANTMNFVKYGAAYEGRFLKNYPLALWRIAKVEIGGKTDMEYEAFLRGGGKTGYVATFGYDKYKKEVERLLNRNAGGRVRVKDVFNVLGGYFEMVNGVVENGGRFTTYLTAKESGMTELQSINAAKEVSVNFNRRGSGAMGAVYMQNFFHFFNAAIQGTHNFAHAAKHNPVRAGAAIAMWATLGFAVSTLSKMLFGDDDEYNDIPDYVRQNNLILPIMGAPGKYVLLPLPVELRMLFGLGDMSAQYTRGEYKGRDFTSDVMGKLMDVLPLSIESNATDNFVEAATRTFTPDMISPITEAYLFNENYFGKRITGRNEFNKYVPEYHKVTTGTSKAIIKASERLNSLSGGDYASKGKLDYALLNPSAVEYLFEQYFGGVGKAIAQCYKTVEGAVTGDVQLRNIPVVSGLTYDTENMVPRNYTNERYNHYVKEYEEMQSRNRMYRKGLEGGKDLSSNYKSFANSRAYRRYQTTGFYKKAIESMYDMARLMDGEEKKALYEQARKTKEMMINELDKIGDE